MLVPYSVRIVAFFDSRTGIERRDVGQTAEFSFFLAFLNILSYNGTGNPDKERISRGGIEKGTVRAGKSALLWQGAESVYAERQEDTVIWD